MDSAKIMTHPIIASAPDGRSWIRPAGRTGLSLTAIGLGGAPLGSIPNLLGYKVPEDRALELVSTILRSPIGVIDTSNNYNDGESERRIGKALKKVKCRSETAVITKVDACGNDYSGDRVRASVKESMQRIGVEYLPLVHLHDPEYFDFDYIAGKGGAVDALIQMREDGRIGAIGVAGGHIPTIRRYVELDVFDALLVHNRLTLVDRSADGLVRDARSRGMAVFNAAVFGGGLLADPRSGKTTYAYRPASVAVLDAVAALADVAERYKVDLGAIALQASMREPFVDCTLVGMSRPQRVAWTLEAVCTPLPEALWEEVDALLPDPDHWIDAQH